MRDWCKHRYGFVNFDDEFMYFNRTGNWSNLDDLGELNQKGYPSKISMENNQVAVIFLFLIIDSFVLFGTNILEMGASGVILLALATFGFFNFLSIRTSPKFKIPYAKIQSIELKSRSVDLVFTDSNGKEEMHHVQGLYDKGIDLFSLISDNYVSRSSKTQKTNPEHWEI